MHAMAPEPEPERHIRRAVEHMTCDRGHTWLRLRDASGYVQRECPECGGEAVVAIVRTTTLVENPKNDSSPDHDGMWEENAN
jgi:hypothetical protein